METLIKQLAALGLAGTQNKVEQHLADVPSFALSYHEQMIRNEPATITLAIKRFGVDDYRLDAFHLARILVPEKEVAGINTRALEDRIKKVDWQTPYRSYPLEDRAKIDQIWNDYWLLAKEPPGKDIQARLFLKYWKDSQMGSGAPRSGLEPVQFQTSNRFPVTKSLSFTAKEAFDLMDGKTVKKFTGGEPGEAKEKQFILLRDEDPLHYKHLLFELSNPTKDNTKSTVNIHPQVTFMYDQENNKHLLSPVEQARWSRIANLTPKLAATDHFQELMPGVYQGRGARR